MKKDFLTSPAPKKFRPVAFYFLNHYLEEDVLRFQISEMAAKGFGGIMLHPRDGLKTPYLSDAFAKIIGVAIDEAKKHQLSVWLYDELHYPSGAAGKLLPLTEPDRTQKSIAPVMEKILSPGEECIFERPDHISLPGGEIRLTKDKFYAVIETSLVSGKSALYRGKRNYPNERAYLCSIAEFSLLDAAALAAPIYSGALNPDGSDAELTDEFINITHKFYADRFGAEFGKTIPGIFGDNFCPNFGIVRRSAPWGKDFARRFKKATGKSVTEFIPALFCAEIPGAAAKRIVFWQWFGREFLNSYYGRIAKFCSQRRLLTTGHLCLEDGMAEHVRQIGDYFEVMNTMTLCAVDQLGPLTPGKALIGKGVDEIEDLTGCIRNTASAALWSNSPRVMCECFGLASANWNLSLLEMRRISGWLFSLGVDLFVPHGIYYSIAAHRKWECTPDHLHNSIWHHYRSWSDWIGKLCELFSESAPTSQVLVLYPVQSLRAHLELGVKSSADKDKSCLGHGEVAGKIQQIFRKVLNTLTANHIQYEVIDEETLKKVTASGSFRGNKNLRFNTIILPAMDVVNAFTARFLSRYRGKTIFVETKPEWSFSSQQLNPFELPGKCVKLKDIVKAVAATPLLKLAPDSDIITRQSRKPDGTLLTSIFNASTEMKSVEVAPHGGFWFDPADNSMRAAKKGNISLEAAQMLVLVENSSIAAPKDAVSPLCSGRIPAKWQLEQLDPNLLKIDRWELSFCGVEKIARTAFECKVKPEKLILLLDHDFSPNEMAAHRLLNAKLFVNGNLVEHFAPGTTLDHAIWEADISRLVVKGVNNVEFRQNGYLEMFERPVYPLLLAGVFTTRSGAIDKLRALKFGDFAAQGLEFYSGRVAAATVVALPEKRKIILQAKATNVSVEGIVNGKSTGFILGGEGAIDLSEYAGTKVKIELIGANLPHNLWESKTNKQPFGFPEAPKLMIEK